jgi:DNA-binding response OmpR family regulator
MTSEDLAAQDALRPRLLLVEDDQPLGAMLASVLGEEGYRVRWARDGHSGLHLA